MDHFRKFFIQYNPVKGVRWIISFSTITMALKIVQIVIEDEVSAPEGEDWEVEIANDPHPSGQMVRINGEDVYVFI